MMCQDLPHDARIALGHFFGMMDVIHDISGDDFAEFAALDEFAGAHHAGFVDVIVPRHADEILRLRQLIHLVDFRERIRIDAYDYRATDQGAAWSADVYREDWHQVAIDDLQVMNAIWIRNGKLADFTSKPRDQHHADRLGALWRPGALPERHIH